jgi:gliding motility-associated transport system ATP-binding protein
MIEIRDLRKFYGDFEALKGVSFSVAKGEILGFLGPNGAGKTTCMKILTGYMAATDGQVVIDGVDLDEDPVAAREKIGYLPEHAPLYTDMNVFEYLIYVADVRGIARSAREERVASISRTCGLSEVLARDVSELSKGYRQRLALAAAMIHDPEILILDEPTSGLDPNQIVEIRNLIKEIGRSRTVILSSHNLPEVVQTCDRVIIVHRGELVADGTPEELEKQGQANPRVVVKLRRAEGLDAEGATKRLAAIEGVRGVVSKLESEREVLAFELETPPGVDVREAVFASVAEAGWSLLELRRDVMDIEALFGRLTRAI